MTEFWLDNHLSPSLAIWMGETFPSVTARSVRNLGLGQASDSQIFEAAFAANAVMISKDSDFAAFAQGSGDGAQVVWLTCGNTSNARLKQILAATMPQIMVRLAEGQRLIRINDEHSPG